MYTVKSTSKKNKVGENLKMKRLIVVLLLLCLVLPLLSVTGCQTEQKEEPVALSFVRIGNDAAEADYWKRVIADFNAENPDVLVTYDDAAIGEAMETKLNAMFSAGLGPDLIGHGIMSVAARVEAGHYKPITPYFDTWDGKDDLMPSVLANGVYQGEVYGLAYSTTPFIFAWRKDLFSAEGLDPEKPPQNWAELESYARTLSKKDSNDQITQSGFAFPRSAGNFVEFDTLVFGNGGLFYDAEGNPTLNGQAQQETLEFLSGFVADVSIAFSSTDTNPFIAGTAAMTLINNVALTPMLQNPDYEGKVGIALAPHQKDPAMFCGCNMLFIGGDSSHPDEAFTFIEFALSADEVMARAKELNIPVTRQSLVASFTALDPMNAVRAECVEKGIGMPRTTWAATFQKIRNDLVQQVLYNKMPAADALANAQSELEAEIAAP